MRMKWIPKGLGLILTVLVLFGGTVFAAERMTKEQLKEQLGDPNLSIIDVRMGGDWSGSEYKIHGAVREELALELKNLRKIVRDVGEIFILRREGEIETIVKRTEEYPFLGLLSATRLAEARDDRFVAAFDLGGREGSATVWTCDLTEKYIEINGAYRT